MNNTVKQARIDGYNDAYVTMVESFMFSDTYTEAENMIEYMLNVSYKTLENADEISYTDVVYHHIYINTLERLKIDVNYCHIVNHDMSYSDLAWCNTDIANTTNYFLCNVL